MVDNEQQEDKEVSRLKEGFFHYNERISYTLHEQLERRGYECTYDTRRSCDNAEVAFCSDARLLIRVREPQHSHERARRLYLTSVVEYSSHPWGMGIIRSCRLWRRLDDVIAFLERLLKPADDEEFTMLIHGGYDQYEFKVDGEVYESGYLCFRLFPN